MKLKNIRRLLSLLTALAFCLSWLPLTSVYAADFDKKADTTHSYFSDDAAVVDAKFSGALIRLVQSDSNDDRMADGIVRIDVGVINPKDPLQSIQAGIWYDKDIVAPLRVIKTTGKFSSSPLTDNATAANLVSAIVPMKFQESMLASGISAGTKQAALSSYVFQNTANGLMDQSTAVEDEEGEYPFSLLTAANQGASAVFENEGKAGWLYLAAEKGLTDVSGIQQYLSSDFVDSNGNYIIKNQTAYLMSVYFKVVNDASFTANAFGLYEGAADLAETGALVAGNTDKQTDVAFVGFPIVETLQTATVRVTATDSASMEGATVKVTGGQSSGNGVNYANQTDAVTTATVGADGTATLKLFPGTYEVTANDFGEYAPVSAQTLTITETSSSCDPIQMQKTGAKYTVNIRAVSKDGKAITMDGTTALKVDDSAPTAWNGSSFTVSKSANYSLTLSGIPGYQNIVSSDNVVINVAAKGASKTEADVTVIGGETIAKKMQDTDGSVYIQLTLQPTVTKVTIPVPVPPEVTDPDEAKKLTVTFTNDKETITVPVTVTENPLSATAEAPLPEGSYTMTIGGSGFDPKSKPVTVINTPDGKTVVNVGGTATKDEETGVTTVTGGVTAVVAQDENHQDAAGNTTVDLTADGDTLQKDATVTVPKDNNGTTDNTTSAGTSITGGLLDGNAGLADQLTPAVMTDPVYEVETELVKYSGSNAYEWLVAKIYLKNAEAAGGTFGMRYDTDLLELPTDGKTKVITPDPTLNWTEETQPEYQAAENGYVYFQWKVPQTSATKTEVQAKSAKVPIATVQLHVKPDAANFHNNMLTALTFTETSYAKGVSGDKETKDETLGAFWRHKDSLGASNHNGRTETGSDPTKYIADTYADGDGFYQIAHTEGTDADAEQKLYDIRIQFTLPEEVTKTSAQFWVREDENHGGIENAEITVYGSDGTTVTETKKTDANGRATVVLEPGTYYYTITETSHWDYPNGEAENPGYTKDQFTLASDGTVTMATLSVTVNGEPKTMFTEKQGETITPFMKAKTWHKVDLADAADATEAALTKLTISSSTTAYNSVRYYFTLQPGAGYTWKSAVKNDMNTVAAKLSAKLYAADPTVADDAADAEKLMFRTRPDTLTAPGNIKWDAAREQFYIDSTIGGAPIGKGDTPLRAGDLMLLVSDVDDLVEAAQYKITVSAGKGGQVAVTDKKGTLTGGAPETGSTDTYTGPVNLTEQLNGGGDESGKYTFTPRGSNTIDKVIINGAAQSLTLEEKKGGYEYQFQNITGNQSIYVTFLDPNGNPLSDASLTVTVGDHGTVKVSETPAGALTPAPDAAGIAGPDAATYILAGSGDNKLTGLGLTITPATGYEIDQVLVNGTKKDNTADLNVPATDTTAVVGSQTGGAGTLALTPAELTALVAQGAASSITVTFKPYNGPSTQAIVTAVVKSSSGTISPAGISIYPMGATPTYSMTPGGDEWELLTAAGSGSVVLTDPSGTETDESTKITGTAAPYSYTLPPLTEDTGLAVTFSEKTYEIRGLIQTAYYGAGKTAKIEKAKLTFVRQADGKKVIQESDDAPSQTANATLSFNAKVPLGTWDVTISKQGYLTYTITGIKVTNSGIAAFGDTNGTTMEPVVLTPGDAVGDGLAVAVNDASMVVAGWLNNASTRNRYKGDIDESEYTTGTGSASPDMDLVRNNIGRTRTRQTYDDFCANGSSTVTGS